MSKDIKIDGQLNFLELMGAYTDDSGASVSVTKPRNEIKGRKGSEAGISVKDGAAMDLEPEQLSFSLDIISVGDDSCKPIDNGILVKELEKIDIESSLEDEIFTTVKEPEVEPTEEPTPVAEVEPVEEPALATEPASVEKPAPATEPASVEKPSPVTEPEPVEEPAPATEPAPSKRVSRLKNKAKAQRVSFFDKCEECWCSDCKHNSKTEGKPREMCGTMMACPACENCIEQGYAEICEIGSAKEGCKTRAMEEGLYMEESV